ncbi:DUF397 domain-containing protein [Streptomyces diastatochromogenes]|uniref:DUF397 domain-containing protein n=1 Tax=Streptomyces diastatochromogenes TaxID=42236 RepID=UPI00367DA1D4
MRRQADLTHGRPSIATGAALRRKSSYSNGDGGHCVEVADNIPGLVPVRDSKVPQGPALILSAAAWEPFVASLKG